MLLCRWIPRVCVAGLFTTTAVLAVAPAQGGDRVTTRIYAAPEVLLDLPYTPAPDAAVCSE